MARATLLLAGLALAAALVLAVAKPQPGKLDSVDVDTVLKNKRLFDNYVKCILDKAPCSVEGTELKQRLPKDLANKCADCTPNDKTRARKVVNHLKSERKDVWEAFKTKFDPESKWGDLDWLN
ncbi:allergen Tha p 1-like [Thrips palmi]|uniref:Allergen Tha p 1-like n=1 Tax=Thrips palmi TaxID=161013 RepID=A0A6P8ZQJ4_THRPL|nr:allergen Tha p 1-like [Thrips palmi]